jgi:hypothetical protein
VSLRMLVFGNALGPDEEQPRIEGLAKEALVVQGAQDARREGHVRVDAVGPGARVQAEPPRFRVPRGDDQDRDGVVSFDLVQDFRHPVKVREEIACPLGPALGEGVPRLRAFAVEEAVEPWSRSVVGGRETQSARARAAAALRTRRCPRREAAKPGSEEPASCGARGSPRPKLRPRNEEAEGESSRELSMKDAKASAARSR